MTLPRLLSTAYVVVALLVPGSITAKEMTTLKLFCLCGQDSHLKAGSVALANEVARRTDERYKIEIIGTDEELAAALGAPRLNAGGEKMLFEGAQSGEFDLVVAAAGALGNFIPETLILDLPFLFRDLAHARTVLDGPVGQDLLAKFPVHGLTGLAWSENGFRHLTNNKRPIRVPEDLKGLKIRVQQNPIHQKAFEILGAQVTPMPYPQVFPALEQGALDGWENSLTVIREDNFAKVQKYLSLTAHVMAPAIFTMSKLSYDKLAEPDKRQFIEAARVGAKALRQFVDSHEATALAELRASGMEVTEDVDRAKFEATLAPAYTEWQEQFGEVNIQRIRTQK
jgi:TRAP-type transport system periplasmic protein